MGGDERSFFGFSSRLSSFLHVDDAKTPRTTKAHTSRVSGPQKKREKTDDKHFKLFRDEREREREREREKITHSARSPRTKNKTSSVHTRTRAYLSRLLRLRSRRTDDGSRLLLHARATRDV